MKIFQIILTLALLTPVPVFASHISDLLNGKAATFDQSQRKVLARNLHDLFRSLDDAVPSLKPSEQEWVSNERKAIALMLNKDAQLERLVNLHESVEFQQENIKNLIKSIMDSLRCVIQANRIDREIYCWSVTSFYLTNKGEFDGAIAILKNGKKLYDTEKLFVGGPSVGYGYFYNSFGRGIQEYFVIPYLKGTLTK